MKTWSLNSFLSFGRDENGAVTVDWVVLTAAIAGLGMVALIPIFSGTESMTAKTTDYIESVNVGFMSE